MTIYIYGCNCGATGARARRIQKYCHDNAINFELRYSKRDPDFREQHLDYLSNSGLSTDGFMPIVVDGDNVIPLRLWK